MDDDDCFHSGDGAATRILIGRSHTVHHRSRLLHDVSPAGVGILHHESLIAGLSLLEKGLVSAMLAHAPPHVVMFTASYFGAQFLGLPFVALRRTATQEVIVEDARTACLSSLSLQVRLCDFAARLSVPAFGAPVSSFLVDDSLCDLDAYMERL